SSPASQRHLARGGQRVVALDPVLSEPGGVLVEMAASRGSPTADRRVGCRQHRLASGAATFVARIELLGVVQVVRDQLGPLRELLAGPQRLDGAFVQRGALPAGQRVVGDLADQLVAEDVVTGLGSGSLLDQRTTPQRPEPIGWIRAEQVAKRSLREGV